MAPKGSSRIPPLSEVPKALRHETINSIVLDGPRVVGKWQELSLPTLRRASSASHACARSGVLGLGPRAGSQEGAHVRIQAT